MKYIFGILLIGSGSLWLMSASDPGTGDWPMWGGTPDRNMLSPMAGIPVSWDIKTKKNVKWMAELGSQSYGNPVVAGGQVCAGTNNELVRNPKEPGDRGVLMCFRESDGKFLWQHTNEKLAAGRALDWPFQGVCSSPLVEGEHARLAVGSVLHPQLEPVPGIGFPFERSRRRARHLGLPRVHLEALIIAEGEERVALRDDAGID